MERVFLKLGGSLITDKTQPMKARRRVLARLAREIAEALAARPELSLLVGHGSGSFGHVVGRQYRTREGVRDQEGWRGYAATARAAALLHRLVCDALWEAGVPALSVPPSASALCQDGVLVHLEVRPIAQALEARLVPVVYGDVALDEVRGGTIVSTEEVFAYLVPLLRPHRIILAGQVAGIYTRDPHRYPTARLLRRLRPQEVRQVEAGLGKSHGVDVTGGMWAKVWVMAALVEAFPDLRGQVLSGERPGNVRRALLDPDNALGTVLAAG
ncbi:MAG: uridylate kinase [Anaerolineae bacterium]|nr:uridylate kinase [Anaerolineae bacterium]